jgi:uncharacterized protein (DUF433 family)
VGGPEAIRYTVQGTFMSVAFAAEDFPLRKDEHGTIRVAGTRVTLDSVVYAFRDGESAEQIALSFPTLSLRDVYLAIGYYLRHQAEVDAYLAQQEREAEEIRRVIEASQDTRGIRERLLARRNQA